MSARRSVALAALAIGLVAGSALLLRSYTSGTHATAARSADSRASLQLEPSRNEEAIERLSEQVAQLRRELKRVEGVAIAAEPAQADEVDSPAEADEVGSPTPSSLLLGPTNEELARPFVDKLKAEAFDPAWARPTEQRIHDALLDETMRDSSLQSARCRSSVCEVTVTHSSEDAQFMFAERFATLGPQVQEAMCQPRTDDDGALSTVCYLARHGQPATFTMPSASTSAGAHR